MSGFGIKTLLRTSGLGMLLMLGGCLGLGEDSSLSSGPNLMRQAIFGNPNKIEPEKPVEVEKITYTCPKVDVFEGGAAYRAGGLGAANVTHQASLMDIARECAFNGRTLTMKVGVEGRMLIGEKGHAGSFTVPLRIVIKHNDKIIASRFTRIAVSVPAGQAGRDFSHVEENISAPITEIDPGEQYDVFVGFDASGGSANPKRARKRRG